MSRRAGPTAARRRGRIAGWLHDFADLLKMLLAWMTGRRYDSPAGAEHARRFIIVQIDGLAHEHLQQAMARGFTPTLERLVAQGHRLQRWRCGTPSSTPAVQAGLMFGDNWNIPGFRWFEKDSGLAPHCGSPFFVARLKARAANGRPGILQGGSSYTNLLDGDARLALFTVSSMGRQRFFAHLRGLGWALLFALIPWRIIRILALVTWELARDIARTLVLWARSRFRRRLKLAEPVIQVFANIVFGEIQTFGVLLDIYRGVPAIYVNYYGYDEVAHTDGPVGSRALRALRRIDGYLHQIERIRKTYWPQSELYICSDHGMTASVPLHHLEAKKPLGQLVAESVRASVFWDQHGRPASDNPRGDSWLLAELDGIDAHLSRRGRQLAIALRRRLREHLPPGPDSGYDLRRGVDVVVRASGSLAHLYFNVTAERMDVSEITILYPDLMDALNGHSGIGLVLGLEDERPVVVTAHGVVHLAPDRLPSFLAERDQLCADLERLLRFPHSGDLVLLGNWPAPGRVVSFEDHAATHGGIGGPQDYPFFLTPPDAPLDLTGVVNAHALYPYFRQRFHVDGA